MYRRLPSLTALRAFEAAARHRSFTRAAEELHVTPAAVSQQIKQLEEHLGVPLFRRGKVLALSEAAAASVGSLSDAFDQLERAVDRLRPRQGAGPLVVSAPPAFAARWLVTRLDDFHTRHPDIELRLLATRRLVDFAVEDVDVAVRFGSGPYTDLHAERLMPEAIVPVAAPELAEAIRTPADLADCVLLHDDLHAGDPAFPDWETWLASLEVNPEQPLRIRRFGDSNLVIQAAGAGLGVALVWHSLVVDELRAGRLVRLLDHSLPTDHGYHLVTLPDRVQTPKVAAFRAWLIEQGMRQQTPP
ncbi:MAG TPA: transcriptional regulator GcvA [Gammaproteobacteria bacterium]|nr:transcriptional regulator GcvA [Gammaproteobacteria bacterium]